MKSISTDELKIPISKMPYQGIPAATSFSSRTYQSQICHHTQKARTMHNYLLQCCTILLLLSAIVRVNLIVQWKLGKRPIRSNDNLLLTAILSQSLIFSYFMLVKNLLMQTLILQLSRLAAPFSSPKLSF